MTYTGPQIDQALKHCRQQIEHEIVLLRENVDRISRQLQAGTRQRSASLVQLAEHYLPELTGAAVAETWAEVRGEIQEILYQKQEVKGGLEREIDAETTRRRELEERLADIDSQRDGLVGRQEQLEQTLVERLSGDKDFSLRTQQAGEAELRLEANEVRLASIHEDAQQKLPAYQQSPFFQYLYRRGFSTKQYRCRGLTFWMDNRVSKLIDFPAAKTSYDFLKRVPKTMEGIVAKEREALEDLLSQLEALRDAHAQQIGLNTTIAEVLQATAMRGDVVKSLEDARVRLDDLRSQRTELEDSRGSYYREAIDRFRVFLESRDLGTLQRNAQSTATLTDDQIVARLRGIDAEHAGLADTVSRQQQHLLRWEQQLQEISRLQQQFRSAGFESSRSEFERNLDFDRLLSDFRDGTSNADTLWLHLRRSQRFKQRPVQRAGQITAHPMTQVLIQAMTQVAVGTMQESVRRAGHRRLPKIGVPAMPTSSQGSRPIPRPALPVPAPPQADSPPRRFRNRESL